MLWFVCGLGSVVGVFSAVSYLWLSSIVSQKFSSTGLSNLAQRVWKLTDPQNDVDLMDGYRSIFGDLLRIGLARALVAFVSTSPVVAMLLYSQRVALEGPCLLAVTISSLVTLMGSWLVGRSNKR